MGEHDARIALKRAYDEPDPGDGTRVLVERLWPRLRTALASNVQMSIDLVESLVDGGHQLREV
jgi:uncharacterized protein YeaO (DUF488 family)